MLGNMGVISKNDAYADAKPLVAKALELDPQLSAAHAVRGWALLLYDLDFRNAGAEFKRAVELDPSRVESHEGLSDYYATMGQLQESIEEMQRARELDPLGLIVNTNLCEKLFFARRYDDALAQCKANLDLDPNSARASWIMGDVYAAKGMNSEAASAFLQALQRAGARPAIIAAATAGARGAGLKGYWKALVQFTHENVANGNLDRFSAAIGYVYAGDADKALPWLGKAVEARDFGITYLSVNPIFDGLRSDARFVSLLKRTGVPQNK